VFINLRNLITILLLNRLRKKLSLLTMKKSMSTQEIVNGLSEILVEDPKSEARDPEKTYPGTPDLF
jgi:hypothetical protein